MSLLNLYGLYLYREKRQVKWDAINMIGLFIVSLSYDSRTVVCRDHGEVMSLYKEWQKGR